MIDFDKTELGDLRLDPATNDIALQINPLQVVSSEIIEMFDMALGDDIDYPEIYSNQRQAMNSTEFKDQAFRVRDAERILRLHPLIKNDSIEVSLNTGNQIIVSFELNSGEKLNGFVMR